MNESDLVDRLVGLIVWDGPWLPSQKEVNFGTPVLEGRRLGRGKTRWATRTVGVFVLSATCECILRSEGGEEGEPWATDDPPEWTTFHSLLLAQVTSPGNPPRCIGVDVVDDGLSLRIGDDMFLDLRYTEGEGIEQWGLVDTMEGIRYAVRVGPQGQRVVMSEKRGAHRLRLAPESDVHG